MHQGGKLLREAPPFPQRCMSTLLVTASLPRIA
jgi:hypothetical protein